MLSEECYLELGWIAISYFQLVYDSQLKQQQQQKVRYSDVYLRTSPNWHIILHQMYQKYRQCGVRRGMITSR